MANTEHLAKLKEGVEASNLWRAANENIRPDLAGADLAGVNLLTWFVARHLGVSHARIPKLDR
jgi:hypothetical protein